MLVYERRETAVFYILSLRVCVAVGLSNRTRNETPRRRIMSSLNEISTEPLGNKVVPQGVDPHPPPRPLHEGRQVEIII